MGSLVEPAGMGRAMAAMALAERFDGSGVVLEVSFDTAQRWLRSLQALFSFA